MKIGVERRRRRAVDEGQRHLVCDARLGDATAVLVLAGSRYELTRFLCVAARPRRGEAVGGLRLASKMRLVRGHEMHSAGFCVGMPAVENRMRAVSVAD